MIVTGTPETMWWTSHRIVSVSRRTQPWEAAVPGTPLTELNKHWVGVMDLAYLLAETLHAPSCPRLFSALTTVSAP